MQKGQTNNPNGRPKGSRNKNRLEVKDLIGKAVSDKDWAIIFSKAAEQAKAGDDKARKFLAEYNFGKPVQPIEGQQDGNPIQHEHTVKLDERDSESLRAISNALAKGRFLGTASISGLMDKPED